MPKVFTGEKRQFQRDFPAQEPPAKPYHVPYFESCKVHGHVPPCQSYVAHLQRLARERLTPPLEDET